MESSEAKGQDWTDDDDIVMDEEAKMFYTMIFGSDYDEDERNAKNRGR